MSLSASFGSQNPILRDNNPGSSTCLPGYGTLVVPNQSSPKDVWMSCDGAQCENGNACQTNQKAGTCKNKTCVQNSSYWRRLF